MTSEERSIMQEKANGMSETDLSALPVGTRFHVLNGNWWGEIVMDEDSDKAIKFLPSGVTATFHGDRTVTTYDVSEIRANSLAVASPPQKLDTPYLAVIDHLEGPSDERGKDIA